MKEVILTEEGKARLIMRGLARVVLEKQRVLLKQEAPQRYVLSFPELKPTRKEKLCLDIAPLTDSDVFMAVMDKEERPAYILMPVHAGYALKLFIINAIKSFILLSDGGNLEPAEIEMPRMAIEILGDYMDLEFPDQGWSFDMILAEGFMGKRVKVNDSDIVLR